MVETEKEIMARLVGEHEGYHQTRSHHAIGGSAASHAQ